MSTIDKAVWQVGEWLASLPEGEAQKLKERMVEDFSRVLQTQLNPTTFRFTLNHGGFLWVVFEIPRPFMFNKNAPEKFYVATRLNKVDGQDQVVVGALCPIEHGKQGIIERLDLGFPH